MQLITSDSVLYVIVILIVTRPTLGEDGMVGKVVYGVNAGGSQFTDTAGIFYEADPCTQGISSNYGQRYWKIGRVQSEDAILYQTERYGFHTFGYTIPIKDDGNYVLVLKFSEVYFLNSLKKVFDVVLNKRHVIVKDLDIFAKVGHAAAHDEYIPFSVTNNGKLLSVESENSAIRAQQIKLEFVKGELDNPKINAFYVIKGDISDVPQLPPHEPQEIQEFETDEFDELDLGNWNSADELVNAEQLQAQEKRRRRILRDPGTDIPNIESEEWMSTSLIQLGISVALAFAVAIVVRKLV